MKTAYLLYITSEFPRLCSSFSHQPIVKCVLNGFLRCKRHIHEKYRINQVYNIENLWMNEWYYILFKWRRPRDPLMYL